MEKMAFGKEHDNLERDLPLMPRKNTDFAKEAPVRPKPSQTPQQAKMVSSKQELEHWDKYPTQPSLGKIMSELEKIKERSLKEPQPASQQREQLPKEVPPLQQFDQMWIHGPPPFYNVIARLRFRRWWHCRPLRSG